MSSGFSHQGFSSSLYLHVAVAAIVGLAAWLKPFERRKPETIFEVIQIPLGTPGAAAPAQAVAPTFNLPDPPPRRTPPPPPTPAPPTPQPQRTPPPVQREALVPPPKPAPPPKPKPTPAPPEQVSYEEFVKEHGPPKPRPPRAAPAPTPTRPPPRIDTRFSVNLSDAVRSPGSLSGVSGAALTALNIYVAALNDRLKEAWANPLLARTAVVDFDVAANGRISNVRIAKSSGNSAFDESVLAAFRVVTSGGPTPDGKPLALRFNFNGIAQ